VIGLRTWETVDIIRKGPNYGYSLREGPQQLNADNTLSAPPENDVIPVQIDATKTDPVTVLNQVAQRYGQGMGTNDHWPKVFDELVNKGKLPGAYHVMGAMDREDQKAAAADLSRSLGVIAQKGGMAAVKAGATDQAKEIDKQVESKLENFRYSTAPNEGGQKLYHTVQEAAQALAYYYAFQGKSASTAAELAVDGIINHKYDFDTFGQLTARVPKLGDQDMTGVTKRAARQIVDEIVARPEQLPPLPGGQFSTPAERKAFWAEAIRNGGWANNEDDTGLVLMGQLRNGAMQPVRLMDGSPVVLKFRDAPAIANSPANEIGGPAILQFGNIRWPWQPAPPPAPVGSGGPGL